MPSKRLWLLPLVALVVAGCHDGRSSSAPSTTKPLATSSSTATSSEQSTTSTTDFFDQPPTTTSTTRLPVCARQLGAHIASNVAVATEPTSHVAEVVIGNDYGPDCAVWGFVTGFAFSGPGGPTDDVNSTVTHLTTHPSNVRIALRLDPQTGRSSNKKAAFEVYTTSLDPDGRPCPAGHMISAVHIAFRTPDTGVHLETLSRPVGETGNALTSCDGRMAITALHEVVDE